MGVQTAEVITVTSKSCQGHSTNQFCVVEYIKNSHSAGNNYLYQI